jgi:hypothetical protein
MAVADGTLLSIAFISRRCETNPLPMFLTPQSGHAWNSGFSTGIFPNDRAFLSAKN